METGIEPAVKLILISRGAALKTNACLSMLVVPDHGTACVDCVSGSREEQSDMNYFAMLQQRRSSQRHAIAADVDGGAPQVRSGICLTEQSREFGGAPKITPALTRHEIICRIQHTSNLFGIEGPLQDKICTVLKRLLPLRGIAGNSKNQCVSVSRTLP